MTVKKLIIAICVLVLSGCTVQKQAMPLSLYESTSYRDASVDQCVSSGFMDFKTAAAAKNFNLQDLSRWDYNASLYQDALVKSAKRLENKPFTKADCDLLAVSVIQRQLKDQQEYQQQQLAVQQQQATSQSIMAWEQSRPKTTYCYKEGDRRVCNTY